MNQINLYVFGLAFFEKAVGSAFSKSVMSTCAGVFARRAWPATFAQ